jgi:hypothetical protein
MWGRFGKEIDGATGFLVLARWPIAGRVTLPSAGLRRTGRPAVGGFGGVGRPAPSTCSRIRENSDVPSLGFPNSRESGYGDKS